MQLTDFAIVKNPTPFHYLVELKILVHSKPIDDIYTYEQQSIEFQVRGYSFISLKYNMAESTMHSHLLLVDFKLGDYYITSRQE